MKLILFRTYILIFITFFFENKFYSQSTYGPKESDSRRNLYSIDYGPAQSSGLLSLQTNIGVGTKNVTGSSALDRYRALYQWNLDGSYIPDGSIITLVNLSFNYEYQPTMIALFYNIAADITDPDLNLQSIFDFMQSNNEMFGSEGILYGTFDLTFINQSDPLLVAIQNSLSSDRFTLGIRECFGCTDHFWSINTPTVKLKIEFTPPEHLVTINQKLNDGQQVGLLRKWEETDFGNSINPGSQISLQVFSYPVIQGDQNLISNQKYHDWDNDLNDVKNHHTFYITSTTEALNSNFNPISSGIIIKNRLESSSATGGNAQFRDPWFIDYPDPAFGNTLRNRGMTDAVFYSRPSPFYPDYNTVYNGYKYQGVFLNQGGTSFTPPYYSVKVDAVQDIYLSQTGKTHKFYFQNWGGTNVNFQNANALETPVVFTLDGATAQANLKGTQLSNNSNTFANNSQRKLIKTPDGVMHLTYESMGRVFYETSTDNLKAS